MSNAKLDARRPLAWYEPERVEAPLFLGYFAAEPSENPTIRPAAAPPVAEPVPGEDGLIIVARHRRPIM